MPSDKKLIRQTVSIPGPLARRVRNLAKNRKVSTNRVLVDLIETGIESKETEKLRFFELADQLSEASSPVERKKIKEKLVRMTFGE